MAGKAQNAPARGLVRRAALAALGALAAPGVRAEAIWPEGPIRFIGIFPPGGGTDILSRIWCQKMSEITGQQFIVENRSGSGGVVGTEAIARAAPDGRTIGLASISALAIAPTLYRKLPYRVPEDFTLIAGLWQLPNLLVINKDVPATTVPELITLIRANPGKFSYASSGSGTSVHLSGAMFAQFAGLDMVHVPYRGGAPAQLDLLAGRVHMIFDNIPQALAEAREGKVRALAVTGNHRAPQAPEIPAMQEFLPGFDITSWGGVLGPAGIPPAIVERIQALSLRALSDPWLKTKYDENGAEVWPATGTELAKYRADNAAALAPVVRASGAQVD